MSTVLNVIIVLGIVIAGSFLLFFLGDFFLSIINSKKTTDEKKEVLQIEHKKEQTNAEAYASSVYVNDYVADEAKEEETVEETAADAEDEEERRIAEARAALEKRKAEILKRMQAQIEEDEEEEEEELVEEEAEDVVEETVEEIVEDSTEEIIAEETAEEVAEEIEDKEEEIVGLINDENESLQVEDEEEEKVDTDALQAEIEKLKNQLGVEKEKYDALAKEFEDHKNNAEQVVVAVEGEALGSKEYYESMLDEKTNQLKVVEKEFKQCKKDFLPLYKVNNTLAKDEKKLHRREAIVAKQKVVLYGVNNYADIDEEKAKKLAEDLDLLDGLKLSVNHCKEVMEANKDRYPILERLYNSLKTQVEGLKSEIENIKAILDNYDETAEDEIEETVPETEE